MNVRPSVGSEPIQKGSETMKQLLPSAAVAVAGMMWLGPVTPVRGQVVNGTILGTVRDSTGGVVPMTSISARNVETGATRTAIADSSGAYQIVSVPAGTYDVEASVQGFKTSVRKGIAVTLGHRCR